MHTLTGQSAMVYFASKLMENCASSGLQPKNNAHARTSFCIRSFLSVACDWIQQAARTSLQLEVKTARTSLR